jgi:hypothetical protein
MRQKQLPRFSAFLLVFITPTGCASTELNYNTLDLASSTDDLMMHQVYYNLANFIDSDLAYPAQAVISGGTASTTDNLSANLNAPWNSAANATTQLVGTLAAASTRSLTSIAGSSMASTTLGVSGTALRSQNWAYAPITEAFRARRLMALYRHAVAGDDAALLRDYPKIYQAVSHNRNACVADQDGLPVYGKHDGTRLAASVQQTLKQAQEAVDAALKSFNEADAAAKAAAQKFEGMKGLSTNEAKAAEEEKLKTKQAADLAKTAWNSAKIQLANLQASSAGASGADLSIPTSFSRCVTSFGQQGGAQITAGSDSYSTMRPDPYYLQGPSCVLCLRYSRSLDKSVLVVNPDLQGQWLHWRALPGAAKPDNYDPNDVYLGQYGHYLLFVAAGQEQKAAKFALFILAAATQSDTGGGAAGGAGSGGASAGGKAAAAEVGTPPPPPASLTLQNLPGGISVITP